MGTLKERVGGNPLLWVSLVAGFLLIAVGVSIKSLDPQFQYRGFVLACGIGAVFAGIGSTATLNYQGLAATGAAAIAIGLFWVMKADPVGTDYVVGQIGGTEKFDILRIRGSRTFIAGRAGSNEPFQFVAFPEDLASDKFVVTGQATVNSIQRDITIGCIPTKLIRESLASTRRVDFELTYIDSVSEWRFADKTGTVWGEFGQPTCSVRPIGKAASLMQPSSSRFALDLSGWLVASAHAQSNKLTRSVPELFKRLDSVSLDERARARTELSFLRDGSDFAVLAKQWNVANSGYRTDLGVVSSWVGAIRADRAAAPKILMSLTKDQIDYVIALTGHPDRTVRLNAIEALSWFLQSTGWPGAPPAESRTKELLASVERIFGSIDSMTQTLAWRKSVEQASGSPSQHNVFYNVLSAIADASCEMKPADMAELKKTVTKFQSSFLTTGAYPQLSERVSALDQASAKCKPS